MTCHLYAVVMSAPEDQPKYRHIADDLRARMDSGEYPPGARLPSKSELMAAHGVALATVNSALGVLRKEGRLETVHGKGTFATEPPEPRPDVAEMWRELVALRDRLDEHERRGHEPEPGRG